MSDDDAEYEPISPASLPTPSHISAPRPIPVRRTNFRNRDPYVNSQSTMSTVKKLKSPPIVPARPRSKTFPRPVPPLRKWAAEKPTSQPSNESGKEASQDDNGEEISLEDLSSRYSDSLPIRVQVTRGIYGDDDNSTISTADRYSLHLSRHRDQVKVEDRRNKENFYIPLNSTIQFSVVYNPTRNEEEAIRGVVYPSVKEILRLKPLPRIICVTEVPKSGQPNSRLHAEEILLIKEVVKSSSPRSRSRRQLKVYSFRDRAEKLLDEGCEGHFSTKPQHVKLSLARIMRHVQDPFPLEVVLSPDPTTGSKLPSYLFSRILHMTERRSDAYFIATTLFDDAAMAAQVEPIEIPANLDIEVSVVPLSSDESEQLKATSQDISDTIQGKYVKHYRYTNVTMQEYLTQAEIYAAVAASRSRQESVQSESSDHSSSNIYENPQSPSLPEETVSDDSDYERPSTGSRLSLEKQVGLLEHRVKTFESDFSEMKLQLSSLTASTDKFRERYESLEGEIQQQSELFRSNLEQMQKLHKDLESKLTQVTSQPRVHPSKDNDSTEAKQKNVEYLAKLLPEQILQLIDVIGMGKYRDSFAQEGVSGDVLLECDDRILEHELGVSLRIHRIRLMKLITGKHSAEAYLTGEGAKAKVYVD